MINKNKITTYLIETTVLLFVVGFSFFFLLKYFESGTDFVDEPKSLAEEIPQTRYLYGIAIDSLIIFEGKIGKNQTFGKVLNDFNIPNATINQLVKNSDTVFNLKTIRLGQPYVFICTRDTVPQYFVYEIDRLNYVLFNLTDSMQVSPHRKSVNIKQRTVSGVIESNLWNSMVGNGINPVMAIKLSEIYAWNIDFFGLQKGDNFKVIYDEEYLDTVPIAIGNIYSALFNHQNRDFYAIKFFQDDKWGYFDEKGENLQRTFLKAPLNFSRISSRFSNSRLHPILKIHRAHHGVDYSAPAGTPVFSVGDGVVTDMKYTSGGGNSITIKHNSVYTTGYLHLSGYAKGLKKGSYVTQGQLIGYVGSTGLSTGPHLDFRFWKNGSPVDPLKVESPAANPVNEELREQFDSIKNVWINQLQTIEGCSYE